MDSKNGTLPDQLKRLALKEGSVKRSAPCIFHKGKDGEMIRSRLHVAGIICVSWSPFGTNKHEHGTDFEAFCAWAAERREQKEIGGTSNKHITHLSCWKSKSKIVLGGASEPYVICSMVNEIW